jgi:hypothetical protein
MIHKASVKMEGKGGSDYLPWPAPEDFFLATTPSAE